MAAPKEPPFFVLQRTLIIDMTRRSGSPTAFWDGTTTFNQTTNPGGGASVSAGGASKAIMVARDSLQICIFVTVSAATTVTVEVAHHGALTSEGNEPNQSTPPTSWYALSYVGTAQQLVFAAAGSGALIIPDFEPAWVRLSTSGAATITAGYEVTGD